MRRIKSIIHRILISKGPVVTNIIWRFLMDYARGGGERYEFHELPTESEWLAFSARQEKALGVTEWQFQVQAASTNYGETLQSEGRLKAALAALCLAPGPEEPDFGPAFLPEVGRPLAEGGWDAL